MSYRLEITPSALRDLEKLPTHFRRHIDAHIVKLAEFPRPVGVKSLKGKYRGLLRIRSGNYRIIYHVQDSKLIVTVIKVADRKDVYD